MKKLVFVLGLGVFAACGGGAAADASKDSTGAKDSTPVVAPAVDSAAIKAAADSTAKADSVKAKAVADSVAKAAKKK